MVIFKIGDLLEAPEKILIHQVNIDGIMGGGLAKQIASQYPEVEKQYKDMCKRYGNNYEELKGKVDITYQNGKYIASIFSQKKNFDTDYEAMRIALNKVKEFAKDQNLNVAMPYKIGCGIANGNWIIVLNIITKVFVDYKVSLYKLEG